MQQWNAGFTSLAARGYHASTHSEGFHFYPVRFMFKKQQESPNFKEVETIIGRSVKVEGDFVGEGDVVVEGVVTGSMKTKGSLKVLSGARITANIEAENAVIDGVVDGNVKVKDRLEMGSAAVIKGDISANVLSIDAGAIFNGKCEVRGTEGRTEEAKHSPVETEEVEEPA